MQAITYTQQREKLLRRAAQGEDVTKALDKLDAEREAAQRAQSLAGDVDRARQAIAREEAQAALQKQYDEAAGAFIKTAGSANELAAIAEKAFADVVTAFDAWRAAIEAARSIGSQAHHFQMQGANPVKLPTMPNTGELSVHIVRRFGDRAGWQESTWGKLPRAS